MDDPVIQKIKKNLEEELRKLYKDDEEEIKNIQSFLNKIDKWSKSDNPEYKKNLSVLKECIMPEFEFKISDDGTPYFEFKNEQDYKKFNMYGNVTIGENGNIEATYNRPKNDTFQEIKDLLFN